MHRYVVERLVLFQPEMAEILPALVVPRLQEDRVSLDESLDAFAQGIARPMVMLPAKMVHMAAAAREGRASQPWWKNELARRLLTHALSRISLDLASFPVSGLPGPASMRHFGFLYEAGSYYRPDFRQRLADIPVEARMELIKGYLGLIADPQAHLPGSCPQENLRSRYDRALLALLPALVSCVVKLPAGAGAREHTYHLMDVVATDPPSPSVHGDLGLWLQRLALKALASHYPPGAMTGFYASLRSSLASYACSSCGLQRQPALQTAQTIVDALARERRLDDLSKVLQDLKRTAPALARSLDLPAWVKKDFQRGGMRKASGSCLAQ